MTFDGTVPTDTIPDVSHVLDSYGNLFPMELTTLLTPNLFSERKKSD